MCVCVSMGSCRCATCSVECSAVSGVHVAGDVHASISNVHVGGDDDVDDDDDRRAVELLWHTT